MSNDDIGWQWELARTVPMIHLAVGTHDGDKDIDPDNAIYH